MRYLSIPLLCLLPLSIVIAAPTVNAAEELRILKNQVEYIGKQKLPEKILQLEMTLGKLEQRLEELSYSIGKMKTSAAAPSSTDTHPVQKNTVNKISNTATKTSLDDQSLYHRAITAMKGSNRQEAARDLQQIVQTYPESKWISHAHYWLGEINLQKQQFTEASRQFNIVIEKYPKSPKYAEALIKQAMLYTEQGKIKQATHLLNRIVQEHPESNAASQARSALKKLKLSTQA